MKNFKPITIYSLLLLVLLTSCKYYWATDIQHGEIVWEKVRIKKQDVVVNNTPEEPCVYQVNKPTERIEEKGVVVFVYDSIYIQTSDDDTLAHSLLKHGFLQGQFFLENHESSQCRWIRESMTRQISNDKDGYHVKLRSVEELKHVNLPRKFKKQEENLRHFRIVCDVIGDTYLVNPSVYRLTLINANGNQNKRSLNTYLENAKIYSFSLIGFQV